MANNEKARRVKVTITDTVDGVQQAPVIYSMLTGGPTPPGWTARTQATVAAWDLATYTSQVGNFLMLCGVPEPRRTELINSAEFNDAVNCPLPAPEPMYLHAGYADINNMGSHSSACSLVGSVTDLSFVYSNDNLANGGTVYWDEYGNSLVAPGIYYFQDTGGTSYSMTVDNNGHASLALCDNQV